MEKMDVIFQYPLINGFEAAVVQRLSVVCYNE